MIRILLPFLLLAAICNYCFGQRTLLMLQKRNKNKNAYYKPGDVISFTINGDKGKISGEILDFKDEAIIFKGFEIQVQEISSLYIDEKTRWWLRYKIEQLSLIIGGGYLLLEIVNTGELNKDTLIISGTLIGIGLIARLFIGNRIKIKGRTMLRILEF